MMDPATGVAGVVENPTVVAEVVSAATIKETEREGETTTIVNIYRKRKVRLYSTRIRIFERRCIWRERKL